VPLQHHQKNLAIEDFKKNIDEVFQKCAPDRLPCPEPESFQYIAPIARMSKEIKTSIIPNPTCKILPAAPRFLAAASTNNQIATRLGHATPIVPNINTSRHLLEGE
jgi:hypothetical protein